MRVARSMCQTFFMSDLIKISPFNGLLSFIVSKDSLILFQQAGM